MKKLLLFALFTIHFSLFTSAQVITGGGGFCHVSGNPNAVTALNVVNSQFSCTNVKDTITGDVYTYVVTNAVGTRWVRVNNSTQDNATFWKLNGNTGTVAGTHFLGTTDSIDLVLRTNNLEKLRIGANGINANKNIVRDAILGIATEGNLDLTHYMFGDRDYLKDVPYWGSVKVSLNGAGTIDNSIGNLSQMFDDGGSFVIISGCDATTTAIIITIDCKAQQQNYSRGFIIPTVAYRNGNVGNEFTMKSLLLETSTDSITWYPSLNDNNILSKNPSFYLGAECLINNTSFTFRYVRYTLTNKQGTSGICYISNIGLKHVNANVFSHNITKKGGVINGSLSFLPLGISRSTAQYTTNISGTGASWFNDFLGLNTVTPQYQLDVNGDASATRLRYTQSVAYSSPYAASTIANDASVLVRNTTTGFIGQTNLDPLVAWNNGNNRFNTTGDGLVLGNYNNKDLSFITNNITRATITASGNLGINTLTPQYKLDVSGDARITNLGSGSVLDSIVTVNTLGVLNRRSVADVFSNSWLMGGQIGTLIGGTTNNSDVILNRQNIERLKLGAFVTTLTNSSYTELKTTNTSNSQASVKLSNGSFLSSSTFITSNIDNTITNAANNGDIAINPSAGEMAMIVNTKRKDVHFEPNGKQLLNISFTDITDSCAVSLLPTTRYLRVFKTVTVTSKVRINLPSSPQNNMRVTILVNCDPNSIDIKAENAGQSILSSITRYTLIGYGDVIECWFDSDSEGSSAGKWYVKKL